MLHRHIFPALFLLMVCCTCWLVFQQCGAGRVSEAFADVDVGIRGDITAQENALEEGFWKLVSQTSSYRNATNEHYYTGFQHLQIRQRSYHRFLDSVRLQIAAAAGISLDSFRISHTLALDHPSVKKLLFAGKPNLLMQISARTDSLRSEMLTLADGDKYIEQIIYQIFNTNTRDYYPFNEKKGSFTDLPVTGALAMISHLQLTALEGMFAVLNYCLNKTGSTGTPFDEATPFVNPPTPFVLTGDFYLAEIYLASYSTSDIRNIHILVDKKPIEVKDGIGHFEQNTAGVGTRTFLVEISGNVWREVKGGKRYLDTFQVAREFTYQVIPAFPQVHQSDRLSFLYAYVENPVSVSAVGLNGSNDMRISSQNAPLRNIGGGRCIITPRSLAPVTLATGSISKFKLPVRMLPDPVPMLGDFTSGSIHREELAVQTVLQTRFPADFDFPVNCKILNFHLTRFRGREDPEERDNQGSTFNSSVRDLLKTAQPGDRLVFDEVRVQCGEEPEPRTIGGLSLRVE
jgi:hypothetical protein